MSAPEKAVMYFRHEHLLNTVTEVGVTCRDDETARRIDDTIVRAIERLQAVFSIFEPSSELRSYWRTGESSNEALRSVIELAEFWWGRTHGAFHPGIEPLRATWAQAAAAGVAPSSAQLAEISTQLSEGIAHQQLNLNAIAKGWIVDRAVDEAMATRETPSAVWVSVGGDIVHRGTGNTRVGIEDPQRPFDNVAPLVVVEVSNQAIATSGSSRRGFDIAGRSHGTCSIRVPGGRLST